MSIADTIKGFFLKKPALEAGRDPLDPRRSAEPLKGGRRAGEAENPYLAARRTWNHHVGSVISQRQTWQVVGILSLLIALAAVGGVIHIGSLSKFVPYVVEVDKLGQTVAVGPADAAPRNDPRFTKVVHAAVTDFINDSRMVTPDVALQRKAVFRVYSKLSGNDPATAKMNEWLNGTEDSSPFARAAKEMVSVDIKSAIPQTPDTWQVDWIETTRDRQGTPKGLPATHRALITTYATEPTAQTTDEQLRNNPGSVYVRDFSWSRIQ